MSNKFLEALLILLGIFALLYFLFEIRSIVLYISFAIALSTIGNPIVKYIRKLRILKYQISKPGAVLITLLLFLSLIVAVGAAMIPLVKSQSQNINLHSVEHIENNVHNSINHLNVVLGELGFDQVDLHNDLQLKKLVDFKFIPQFINGLLGALGDFSVALLTILFISFFLMKDYEKIMRLFLTIMPDRHSHNLKETIKSVRNSLSRYILGLMLQVLILFVLYSLLLYLLGVKNFIVIALLGAMLNLIPYVGPMIGLLLVNILSITSHLDEDFTLVIFPMVIKITIGYLIVQLIDNFVNQPIIFSKSTNAHPLEIFIVILIAGKLFGILGMVVAIPVYTVLRIIFKEFFTSSEFLVKKTEE